MNEYHTKPVNANELPFARTFTSSHFPSRRKQSFSG